MWVDTGFTRCDAKCLAGGVTWRSVWVQDSRRCVTLALEYIGGCRVESGCTTCGYYSSICTVLVPDILLISLLVQREVSSVLVSVQFRIQRLLERGGERLGNA